MLVPVAAGPAGHCYVGSTAACGLSPGLGGNYRVSAPYRVEEWRPGSGRRTGTGHAWPSAGGGPPPSPPPSSVSRAPAAQTLLCRQGWGGGVPGEGVRLHFEEREETLLFGSILKRQLVYPSF